jgi:hypothetical protein
LKTLTSGYAGANLELLNATSFVGDVRVIGYGKNSLPEQVVQMGVSKKRWLALVWKQYKKLSQCSPVATAGAPQAAANEETHSCGHRFELAKPGRIPLCSAYTMIA